MICFFKHKFPAVEILLSATIFKSAITFCIQSIIMKISNNCPFPDFPFMFRTTITIFHLQSTSCSSHFLTTIHFGFVNFRNKNHKEVAHFLHAHSLYAVVVGHCSPSFPSILAPHLPQKFMFGDFPPHTEQIDVPL